MVGFIFQGVGVGNGMCRDRAVLEVNGVTLLAGLLVLLAVVMGGFTMANPKTVEDVDRTENTPYAVSIEDDRLIIRKQGGDPVTYDQLLVYLSAGETDERLDVDDDSSRSQDTDSLFEEGEAAVVQVLARKR